MDVPSLNARALTERALDRRTLLKAGAWAAPAIAVTTAVPALMASPADKPKWSDAFGPWDTWSDTTLHHYGNAMQLNNASAPSLIGTAHGTITYAITPQNGAVWKRSYGPEQFTVNKNQSLQLGFAMTADRAVPAGTYTITVFLTFTSGTYKGKTVSTAFTGKA